MVPWDGGRSRGATTEGFLCAGALENPEGPQVHHGEAQAQGAVHLALRGVRVGRRGRHPATFAESLAEDENARRKGAAST